MIKKIASRRQIAVSREPKSHSGPTADYPQKTAHHSRGFTLLETLVAVSVLTIAIVGPFQVAQGVLKNAYIARDQLIATALAEEGVEFVRNVRDSNYLANVNVGANVTWLAGFDGTNGPNCYSANCVIDPSQYPSAVPFVAGAAVSTCGSTCPLYLRADGTYTQLSSGNATTVFTRIVRLQTITAYETKVTVTVSWTSHGSHSVILTENLQNWL